ncbi:MAG: hypothetical protein MI861_13075, partial [Pirellulales bacterium]|nr:hypothetical protein [Pirellulales bacterium]
MSTIVFWLSLLASVLYTLGVLCLKRSTQWQPGPWLTTFLCNMITVVAFLPLFAFGGAIPSLGQLWQPALVGALFLAGQVLVVLALTHGDVSIATPIFQEGVVFVSGYWEGSKAIRLGRNPSDAELIWTENRYLR